MQLNLNLNDLNNILTNLCGDTDPANNVDVEPHNDELPDYDENIILNNYKDLLTIALKKLSALTKTINDDQYTNYMHNCGKAARRAIIQPCSRYIDKDTAIKLIQELMAANDISNEDIIKID